jgi:hypothetical protein
MLKWLIYSLDLLIMIFLPEILGGCWPLTKFWEILGQCLTYFGTSTTYRRQITRRSRDRGISAPFWVIFGIWEYVMGMGCRPMGLPMFRPIL